MPGSKNLIKSRMKRAFLVDTGVDHGPATWCSKNRELPIGKLNPWYEFGDFDLSDFKF